MSAAQKLKNRPDIRAIDGHRDAASGRYDLFVAAPMAGLASRAQFVRSRETILAMIQGIVGATGARRVYYAGTTIGDAAPFTEGEDALDQDLGALRRSKALLLIYPEKIATGALVELGFALALRRPVAILVRSHDDLPYFLRHLRGASEPATTGPVAVLDYGGDDDLAGCALQALRLLDIAGP
jgi:hypothetical protein